MATQVATRSIPSIEEIPLIGSYPAFNRDRLGLFQALARSCGDVSRFHLGPFPALFFNTSELVHSVLVEHAHDFDIGAVRHNAFGPVIGNGLFTSEGDFHRRQRKAMAPAFQPRHIQRYADTMASYAERVQAEWSDGAVVDVSKEMTHLTMCPT
jgi:cytochrome P450